MSSTASVRWVMTTPELSVKLSPCAYALVIFCNAEIMFSFSADLMSVRTVTMSRMSFSKNIGFRKYSVSLSLEKVIGLGLCTIRFAMVTSLI